VSDLTHSISVMTQALVNVLEEHQQEIGLKRVYYGDQSMVPDFPSVGVETAPLDRLWDKSSTHKFEINLRCDLYLYVGRVQSSELTKQEVDALTQRVEDAVHIDFTVGGLVIFGYIERIEPGVSMKSDVMVQTTRLSWVGLSRQTF
jgi:hypothetical protein